MEPHLIIAVAVRGLSNATMTVYVDGHAIGTVLQDGPDRWLATPAEAAPPPHPSLEDAVEWLIEQHRRRIAERAQPPEDRVTRSTG